MQLITNGGTVWISIAAYGDVLDLFMGQKNTLAHVRYVVGMQDL